MNIRLTNGTKTITRAKDQPTNANKSNWYINVKFIKFIPRSNTQ